MTAKFRLVGFEARASRLTTILTKKREKYGESITLSYPEGEFPDHSGLWYEWKNLGLIAGFGFSTMGFDQIRFPSGKFVPIYCCPDAFYVLSNDLVTESNILQVADGTHFVVDGKFYELPRDLMFKKKSDDSSLAKTPDISNSLMPQSVSLPNMTGTAQNRGKGVTRIQPYMSGSQTSSNLPCLSANPFSSSTGRQTFHASQDDQPGSSGTSPLVNVGASGWNHRTPQAW